MSRRRDSQRNAATESDEFAMHVLEELQAIVGTERNHQSRQWFLIHLLEHFLLTGRVVSRQLPASPA